MSDQTQAVEEDLFTFESAANKEFPIAPAGIHKVIVTRALYKLLENTFDKEKKGQMQNTVNLMLQSDQQYKDESTGEMRPYNLFRTMKISDHPQSGMYEFFQSVMGMDVPLKEITLDNGTKVKRIAFQPPKIVETDDGEEKHMTQFEHLEFSVVVKHEKKDDGKMKDKVDSIVPCTPDQQKANAALFLAPQA